MRVFLIHGMGRTPLSFALLRRRLQTAGHEVTLFHYLVLRESLEQVSLRFAEQLAAHRSTALAHGQSESFAVIGHSLGNVITRMCLPLSGLQRFVMLAPPNRPPVMARTLTQSRVLRPFFAALTRDAGKKLTDDDFFARLPVPDVPSLVIAGNHGPRQPWLPFNGAPSDGVVAVEETILPGVPHVEVQALHTFIMNDLRVARIILRFLETGDAALASTAAG